MLNNKFEKIKKFRIVFVNLFCVLLEKKNEWKWSEMKNELRKESEMNWKRKRKQKQKTKEIKNSKALNGVGSWAI